MSGGERNNTGLSPASSTGATRVLDFEPRFARLLPETHFLLTSGKLILHQMVSCVVLHGSRGLSGKPRADSDIDLSLIVHATQSGDMERDLQEVLDTTLTHWLGLVELDLAAIFDIQKCGLKCFEHTVWNEQICQRGGTDCFGLYKTQKGYHGLTSSAGIQVKRMYPCFKIWQRRYT